VQILVASAFAKVEQCLVMYITKNSIEMSIVSDQVRAPDPHLAINKQKIEKTLISTVL
jgi:hypothetical protein